MAAAYVQDDLKPLQRISSYQLLPPDMSELSVVLLGNNWSERCSVGNLILGTKEFNSEEEADSFVTAWVEFKNKKIVVINTPDLLQLNIFNMEIRHQFFESHVFLLLLQPEDFSEEHRLRLCRVLQFFGDQSFEHSLVLILSPTAEGLDTNYKNHPPLRDMIRKCRYRHLRLENLELEELITELGQTAKKYKCSKSQLSCEGSEDQDTGLIMKSPTQHHHLNILLCGRKEKEKTLAAEAILGQTEPRPNYISLECGKNEGEVCGYMVSLVKLPALYGKPLEVVMEEALRCVLHFDPEGIHAFILVLPEVPPIDEDKAELETIQNTFGSRVNDFTVITAVGTTDIPELHQSSGERFVAINLKDQQQVSEMLDTVSKKSTRGAFTKDMFTQVQMNRIVDQGKTNTRLKAELGDVNEKIQVQGQAQAELKRVSEILRKREDELVAMRRKVSGLTEDNEREKKLRANAVKEKEDYIKKEREKREQQEKKWKKQEEAHLRKMEAAVRAEREQREVAERKQERFRNEIRRDHEAWDKEKKEMWEQRHQELKESMEEEKSKYDKLQREYNHKKKIWKGCCYVLVALLFLFLCFLYIFQVYINIDVRESATERGQL